jgi:hypothetical protein
VGKRYGQLRRIGAHPSPEGETCVQPDPQEGFGGAAGLQEPLESSGMREGMPSFTGKSRWQAEHSRSSPFGRMAEPQVGQTNNIMSSGETGEV